MTARAPGGAPTLDGAQPAGACAGRQTSDTGSPNAEGGVKISDSELFFSNWRAKMTKINEKRCAGCLFLAYLLWQPFFFKMAGDFKNRHFRGDGFTESIEFFRQKIVNYFNREFLKFFEVVFEKNNFKKLKNSLLK